jgi:hypothetical protein
MACPGEQELVRAALALGAAPEAPPSEPLAISVRFEGDGASLRAVVSSTGPKVGERELRTEGTDCGKLAEAAAVVIALLLDIVPASATHPFEPAAPAPAPAPSPTPPAPSVAPASSPAPAVAPPTSPEAPQAPRGAPFELRLRAEAGPALALRLRLHRSFALRASALGLVTLGRRTFEVTGYGDAFETPPVAAAVTLGPELLIF